MPVELQNASDVGGGACFFQWQTLDLQVLQNCHTQGVNPDGILKHNYPKDCT